MDPTSVVQVKPCITILICRYLFVLFGVFIYLSLQIWKVGTRVRNHKSFWLYSDGWSVLSGEESVKMTFWFNAVKCVKSRLITNVPHTECNLCYMYCKVLYVLWRVLHRGSSHVNIQAGHESKCIKSRVFIDEWEKEPPQLNCTVTEYHLAKECQT